MRYLFIIVTAFIVSNCEAASTDTAEVYKTYSYNTWCLRSETGINKAYFKSLGISRRRYERDDHHFASFLAYACAEVNMATYNNPNSFFYGYKGGVEYSSMGMMMAFEIHGFTDFNGKEHAYFTPKYGFSLSGLMSLLYGYNCFQVHNNVFGIGRHQVTLSINYSPKLWKEYLSPIDTK